MDLALSLNFTTLRKHIKVRCPRHHLACGNTPDLMALLLLENVRKRIAVHCPCHHTACGKTPDSMALPGGTCQGVTTLHATKPVSTQPFLAGLARVMTCCALRCLCRWSQTGGTITPTGGRPWSRDPAAPALSCQTSRRLRPQLSSVFCLLSALFVEACRLVWVMLFHSLCS
jgi:hypothetical protein